MNGIPFRILIVEDDADDRFIIDEAFKEIGYEAAIKKFVDGEHLMQYLEKIEPPLYPSLIVLDNNLPRFDAANILSTLKADIRYSSIKSVIYTTLVSPLREQELLALGADGCFKKGDDMQQVITIARQLRSIAEDAATGNIRDSRI